MSEPGAAVGDSGTAGAMMRVARQSQGLHIGALAASMKVPQAKLEALEAGRYDELPDPAFTRALAQSVCRTLKIDPSPVLAKLPSTDAAALERVDGGLNMPFRERPGRIDPIEWGLWRHPAFWAVLLLLIAAVLVSYVPTAWVQGVARTFGLAGERTDAPAPTAMPAILPASALAGGIVERVGSTVSTSPTEAGAADPGAAPASGVRDAAESAAAQAVANAATRIRAIEATWVQVTDSRGQILLSRLLNAGEAVGFDVEPPLKIRIGNARGTEVLRRGQAVDLSASTRDNVANVDLR